MKLLFWSSLKKMCLLTDKQIAERVRALPSSFDSHRKQLTLWEPMYTQSDNTIQCCKKQLLCQYREDKLVTDCLKLPWTKRGVIRLRSPPAALFLLHVKESNKKYKAQLCVCTLKHTQTNVITVAFLILPSVICHLRNVKIHTDETIICALCHSITGYKWSCCSV